jgi:hypothetical protein
MSDALRYDQRPDDHTPVHTVDLPATPTRDRNIVATAWIEAPDELLHLGDDLPDTPEATYKRRINEWLLWRAGPATDADARYLAIDAGDLTRQHSFRLFPDGSGDGTGPSGERHTRFRTWKVDLLGRDNSDRGEPGNARG